MNTTFIDFNEDSAAELLSFVTSVFNDSPYARLSPSRLADIKRKLEQWESALFLAEEAGTY